MEPNQITTQTAELAVPPPASPTTTPNLSENKIWTSVIPAINRVFMILSVALVFGLDLIILIASSFSLFIFWIPMLILIGALFVLSKRETASFNKNFGRTKSALDPLFVVLVVIRNFILLLNFIPYIQLFGLIAFALAIFPYLFIYIIMMYFRLKVSQ